MLRDFWDQYHRDLLMLAGSILIIAGMTGDLWFALALFAMISIHECGHLVMLRRYHIRASRPVFTPLGAIISVRQPITNLWQEAWMALMGPVFGGLFSVFTLGMYFLTRERVWADWTWLMALVNLVNLLPIAPLDGGRVIRTLLWSIWIPLLVPFAIAGFLASLYFGFQWNITFFLVAFFSWVEYRELWNSTMVYKTLKPGKVLLVFVAYLAVAGFLALLTYSGAVLAPRLLAGS